MTWPLARNLNRAVADPGDPYINTWILDWSWYATLHQPLHLFEANAFFPAHDSLAYSENLFGIALLLLPLRALGAAPITAHNIAILVGFALSGFAAYLLGRLITASALAGIVSGIFYAFVPFRFTHLSHVQHVWGGTLALLLASLLWYAAQTTWCRATLFEAAFFFNGLCNIHWLLFGSVAIAVTFAIVRPRALPLIVCTALAASVLAVFLQPYATVAKTYAMRRSWNETKEFSARPADWLVSSNRNRFYTPLQDPAVDPERWLFPGALSILLGGVGFLSRDKTALRIAATWLGIGFFGSLGLHTVFHRFLFSWVPGFQAIRVPARWAAIAYLGLAMLVALTSAMIARRRAWVYAALAAAFLVELHAAPILWYMTPADVLPVERWIAENHPRAIIELPMIPLLEYGAMLRATAHHVPMVNGISGFAPAEYLRLATLAERWSDELCSALERIGVTHIIVHADSLDAAGRAWISRAIESRDIAFQQRFDGGVFGDWLFTIGGPPHVSPDLDAMLNGKLTRSATTVGAFFSPAPESTVTPQTIMLGFAASPNGIRAVNLLVNNGAIRLPTELRQNSQFTVRFPSRPRGIWKRTDIQPEIIDGNGRRTLLEDRFVWWP